VISQRNPRNPLPSLNQQRKQQRNQPQRSQPPRKQQRSKVFDTTRQTKQTALLGATQITKKSMTNAYYVFFI